MTATTRTESMLKSSNHWKCDAAPAEKSSNHWNFLKKKFQSLELLFGVILAVLFLVPSVAQAGPQTLGGDEIENALRITCNDDGMRIEAFIDQSHLSDELTWRGQTYSDDKSSMIHYDNGGTFKYTAGYYEGLPMGCLMNSNISSTVNRRVWAGGSVQLTMDTTYVSPSRALNYTFTISNKSESVLSNLEFYHGQDTYLGWSDSGGGYRIVSNNAVGVKKPSIDDRSKEIYQEMVGDIRPYRVDSLGYYDVKLFVEQGHLGNIINTNYYIDNGYAAQWNVGTLNPGETWTVNVSELFKVGGDYSLVFPATADIGVSTVVTGEVRNGGDTTAMVYLDATMDNGSWTSTISGLTSFEMAPGAISNILVNVSCPPVISVGESAELTITLTNAAGESSSAHTTLTGTYYDGVVLVENITDGADPSYAGGSDFGGHPVGTYVTNVFNVYNGGPSNVTMTNYTLTGDTAQFSVSGLSTPLTLGIGESTNIEVVYYYNGLGTHTAALTMQDDKPWTPFVMNMRAYTWTISTNNGAKRGGNEVTLTNGLLGSGADINQVLVGGVNAEVVDQHTNWVTFIMPEHPNSGFVDIKISSISQGAKTMKDCYFVNPIGTFASVSPATGDYGGGYDVTITGTNFCNGTLADMTNVTFQGVPVTTIKSVDGSTQVVVTVASAQPGPANIVIESLTHGRCELRSGFRYEGPLFFMDGKGGYAVNNNGSPAAQNGTDYGNAAVGASVVQSFYITNAESATLHISSVSTNGSAPDAFTVVSLSTTNIDRSEVAVLKVAFTPQSAGSKSATILIDNDAPDAPFKLNLAGTAVAMSPIQGPFEGGQTVEISGISLPERVSSVTIGDKTATIVKQNSTSISFITPAASFPGQKDVTLVGDSFTNVYSKSYTYSRKGRIFGDATDDWTQWETLPDMPHGITPRSNYWFASVCEYDDYVMAVGGTWTGQMMKGTFYYDGFEWFNGPELPFGWAGMALAADDTLHLMGGYSLTMYQSTSARSLGSNYVKSSWTFDGNGFVSNAPLNTYQDDKPMYMAGAYVGGEVYTIGGAYGYWSGGVDIYRQTNIYRLAGQEWVKDGGLPGFSGSSYGVYHGRTAMLSNKLYMVGGYGWTQDYNPVTNAYMFDGTNCTQIAGLPYKLGRLAVGVASGHVYAAGGSPYYYGGSPYFSNRVYRLDGSAWTEIADLRLPDGVAPFYGGATLDDRFYAIGPTSYAYPARTYASGVSPTGCVASGGVTVTITGRDLCDGTLSDVTSVLLAGNEVTSIDSASATQIVVTAAAGSGAIGDVVVTSVKYGQTVASNAFTYSGIGIQVLDADGNLVVADQAASEDAGTAFGYIPSGTPVTNWFTIENTGDGVVTFFGLSTNGSDVFSTGDFELPATLAVGHTTNLPIVCDASTVGDHMATLYFVNDTAGASSNYPVNLSASVFNLSTNAGPIQGGQTIMITNGVMGNGSDISAVYFYTFSATILDQGSNWVQVVTPATEWAMTCDVKVHSDSRGDTVLADAYTYREQAWIGAINYSDGEWKEMNGPAGGVNDMRVGPDGALYACGFFTNLCDGTYVPSRVAKYQYGVWTPVGSNVFDSSVFSIEFMGTNLYVGGAFYRVDTNVVEYMARYNGTDWVAVYTNDMDSTVYALATDGTNLYLGGSFDYFDSPTNVAVWNGTTLENIGSGITNDVYALKYHDGYLYAGTDGSSIGEFARWNGTTWQHLAQHLDDGVFALAAEGSHVYFGGYFTWEDAVGPMDYVGQYDGAISGMAGGLSNRVTAMDTLNDGNIVAGYYQYGYVDGVPTVDNMAVWNGTGWVPCGDETAYYGNVDCLQAVYNGIYVGGDIRDASGGAISNCAFFAFSQTNSISPKTGSSAGGTTVKIPGYNLGNGTTEDVYRVTICGVDVASISDITSTQITVVTEATAGGLGDVVVYTYDYGTIVMSNAFTYAGAGIKVYGEDDERILNGGAATVVSGTAGAAQTGSAQTNWFTIENIGDAQLTISLVATGGANPEVFSDTLPASVAAGTSATFSVVFTPTGLGEFSGSLTINNNADGADGAFVLNLTADGYTISSDEGPWSGGNQVTLTTGTIGSGSDITNVLVDGQSATIVSQSTDSVTIIMPAVTNAGTVNFVIDSSSEGRKEMSEVYTYHMGSMGGIVEDWNQWEEKLGFRNTSSSSMPDYTRAAVYSNAIYAGGGRQYYFRYTNNAAEWERHYWNSSTLYTNYDFVVFNDNLLAVGCNGRTNNFYLVGTNLNNQCMGMPNNIRYKLGGAEVINGKLHYVGCDFTDIYRCAASTPDKDTFWTTNSAPLASYVALATAALSNRMYCIGGQLWNSTTPGNVYTNVYWSDDGVNWNLMKGIPEARRFAAAATFRNQIYVMGGFTNSDYRYVNGNGYEASNVWRYTGSEWEEMAPLPKARGNSGAVVYNDQIWVMGGFPLATNIYAYPAHTLYLGAEPDNGVNTGGYDVRLWGTSLHAGTTTDVTRVTFGGADAEVLSVAGTTQVIVRVNGGPFGAQDVKIYSTLCGITTSSNAFTFTGADIAVLGTNGVKISTDEAATTAKGTDFGTLQSGQSLSRTLVITNAGNQVTTISGIGFGGTAATQVVTDAASFPISLAGTSSTNLTVTWTADGAGVQDAYLVISNSTVGPQSNYVVNLSASVLSMSRSTFSEEGGGYLTISNGAPLGRGTDITNVLFGTVNVIPYAQGSNWVTIVIPAGSIGTVSPITVQSFSLGDHSLVDAFEYVAASAIYGSTFTWTEIPGLPQAMEYNTTFVLNDQLYSAGGYSADYATNVFRFDGIAWHEVEGLPSATMGGMGAVYDGAFYYMGGDNNGTHVTNVYRFDGTNWTQVLGLPKAVANGVGGVVDGRIAVAGGWDAGYSPMTNTFVFDGADWTETLGLRYSRTLQGGAVNRGNLYAFGGQNAGTSQTFNQYSFNGTNWSSEAGMPALLESMGAATLNRHTYSIGGADSTGVTNLVIRYDGYNWSNVDALPAVRYAMGATFWRGAIYAIGGDESSFSPKTNVWMLTDGGVSPISGYPSGGYNVTIRGTNLCAGTTGDVVSVTICGATASVLNVYGSTQIVVTAGSGDVGTGDVVVNSEYYGTITAANAFTYKRGIISLIGTNGAIIESGDAADVSNGSDFGTMSVGQTAVTNTFAYYNSGNDTLNLSDVVAAGAGAGSFTIDSYFPTNLVPGATGAITVVCASLGGEQNGEINFRDSVLVDPSVEVPYIGHTVCVFRVKSYGTGAGMGAATNALAYSATYGDANPAAQTLTVTNTGSEALSCSNLVVYASAGDNWLTVAPTGGAIAVDGSIIFTNNVDISSINVGTHYATVQVYSATATNSPFNYAVEVSISQAGQTLGWNNPGEQSYTNETDLTATNSGSLTLSYTVASGPATVHYDRYPAYVTYSSTGEVTVVASQAGNMNYTAADSVTQSWVVTRSAGVITLTNLTQEYTGSAITADVVTSPADVTYTVTYDGLSAGPTNVGTYEVIALITDPLIYGGVTNTLTITKASQVITFPTIAAQLTNTTVGLTATGGASGNPVTFSVFDGPGVLDTTNLTFSGVGDVLVKADQAGSDDYNAAPTVTNLVRVFSVTPNNGPYVGGNSVIISNGSLGTVTNVIVERCSSAVSPDSTDANWLTLTMPAATNSGLTDITLQSEEYGDILLADAYTYNPAGSIEAAPVMMDYRISFTGTNGIAIDYHAGETYVTNYPPDSTAGSVYTYVNVTNSDYVELAATNRGGLLKNGVRIKVEGFLDSYSGGWNDMSGGLWWLSTNAGQWFIYAEPVPATSIVHIVDLPGTNYDVEVINAYGNIVLRYNQQMHSGFWQPGDPIDTGSWGENIGVWQNPGGGGNWFSPTNTYWWRDRYIVYSNSVPSDGALSVVLWDTNGQPCNVINAMRIRGMEPISPVRPSSGSWTGGYQVTISGSNLGNGDVTNVTICGVTATIDDDYSPTQIVVTANASTGAVTGDIVIQSTSYGTTTKSNAFSYLAPALSVLGTNGAAIESSASFQLATGTKFRPTQPGAALTNTFAITNAGNDILSISGWTTNGTDRDLFTLSGVPSSVAIGGVSNFTVVYDPTAVGSHTATVSFVSDDTASPFLLNLGGSCFDVSTNIGPYAGGNTITITNGNFGAITNILVGPTFQSVTPSASGANWFTITMPSATSAGSVDITVQTSDNGETVLQNAYTYNPAGEIGGTNEDWSAWQEVAGLPAAVRYMHGAVLNGSYYTVGGEVNGTINTNVFRFDGTNWTEVAGLPAARRLAAAATYSNAIYCIAGDNANSDETNTVFKFDGTTWTTVAPLPTKRYSFCAKTYDGYMYAIAGNPSPRTNVYRYNGTDWEAVVGVPSNQVNEAVAVAGDYLYSAGGYQVQNAFRFDGTTWTDIGAMPDVVNFGGGGTLNDMPYFYGGADSGLTETTNVFRYNGTNWEQIVGLPEPRQAFASGEYDGSIYVIGGYYSAGKTNVYRYPGWVSLSAADPASGSYTGEYPVTISGSNLGNGDDITSVTLCGFTANIESQTATRVWVTAGVATGTVTGDIVVQSTSFGTTTKANAFSYLAPALSVLGTNGEAIASEASVSLANGTKFYPVKPSMPDYIYSFSITNTGNDVLYITDCSTNGANPDQFIVVDYPTEVEIGGVSNLEIAYYSTEVGSHAATIQFSSDDPASPFLLNVSASCYDVSTNIGPYAGGNSITITNGTLGDGNDITNVLVGGVGATITDQGSDWVTITLPAVGMAGVKDILVQSTSVGDTFLADIYTYNPAGEMGFREFDWNMWEEVVGLPGPRSGPGAAVYNGELLAYGGKYGSGEPDVASNAYRFSGGNWVEIQGMVSSRAYLFSGVVSNDLYAVGGVEEGTFDSNYQIYDGINWTYHVPPPSRLKYQAGSVLSGILYKVGGQKVLGGSYVTNVYSLVGGDWTLVAGLPIPLAYHAVATMGNNLYSIGGYNSTDLHRTNVFRFNGAEWSEVSGLPSKAASLSAASLDGRLYAMGGYDGTSYRTNVYRYDETNWTEIVGLPKALRYQASVAYKGQVYTIGGYDGSYLTNVYRYPALTNVTTGVTPADGSWTGGYPVTISGTNLGNGVDITNVTLCGLAAAIQPGQSATQLVVIAAAATAAQSGDVVVQSTSYGETVKSNAFSYLAPTLSILGTNGAAIESSASFQLATGTKFRPTQPGAALTNTFAITNTGNDILSISGWTTNGTDRDLFTLSGVPSSVAIGGVSNFSVVYDPTAVGSHTATVSFVSDDTASPFLLNLGGSCFDVSTNVGPHAGGNTITITNGNFGTITNVLISQTGMSALPSASGDNWFTITMPGATNAGSVDLIVQTSGNGETVLRDAYTYNPAGEIGLLDWSTWQEVNPIPEGRQCLGSAAVLSNALYVGGGKDSSSQVTNVFRMSVDGTWSEVVGLPVAADFVPLVTYRGEIYALGGRTTMGPRTNVYRYNGETWVNAPGLPEARCYGGAAALGDDLFYFGGMNAVSAIVDTTYRYDGTNWTSVNAMPAALRSFGYTVYDGAIYTMGGYNGSSLTNVYRFDGTSWTQVVGLPAAVNENCSAALDGKLYSMKGNATNVYCFDGSSWSSAPATDGNLASAAAGTFNGFIYVVGGYDGSSASDKTWRYPYGESVSPASGSWTGGYPVTISGTNLGNGADITNVTLCGVTAAIQPGQSATQLIVLAGAATVGQSGDVVVQSTSFGTTIKSNSFTYIAPTLSVLGTNGAAIVSSAGFQLANGTKFYPVKPSTPDYIYTFAITNTGNDVLTISDCTYSGTNPDKFGVVSYPAQVEIGGVSNLEVAYYSTEVGSHTATINFASDDPNSPFLLNVAGSCYTASTNVGPYAGGNTITITNGSFGTITNVLVGSAGVSPAASGDNWFTITLPEASGAGTVDITVQTEGSGETLLRDAYTYNTAGSLYGSVLDWSLWQQVNGVTDGRRQLDAAALNGKLYAISGYGGSGYTTNVNAFDGTNWTDVAGLPEARATLSTCEYSNHIYAVGGYNPGGKTNVYQFDGSAWTEVSGLPTGLFGVAACSYNGKLYSVGGYGEAIVTNVFAYDGSDWTEVAGLPAERSYMSVGVVNGKLIAAGGADHSATRTNTYAFDGTSWTEVSGLPLGLSRAVYGVVTGQLYVAGGLSSAGTVTNTYRFDGSTWTAAPGMSVRLRDAGSAVLDGALYGVSGRNQSYVVQTNAYRYPATVSYGASPSSGSWTGSYEVVIVGNNLGDGGDITNVTLCDVAATINSQTATRVWISAGAATAGQLGDVVVQSVAYGTTVKTNGFTYIAPTLSVLGTNGAAIMSDGAPSLTDGSKFYATQPNEALTYSFGLTNTGNDVLNISGWTTNEADADLFTVSTIPTPIAVGGVTNFTVTYTPVAVGIHTAQVAFASDDPTSPFLFNLVGSCFAGSTNVGPYAGGNTVTITNGYFGTITNVLVGQTFLSVIPDASGDNWFTITLPAALQPGSVDFVVQTSDNGDTLLSDAYTYNRPGTLLDPLPALVSLTNTWLNGTNGTTFIGADNSGFMGCSVSPAGDVNNDGFNDMLIGAEWADNRVSHAYVIYGKAGTYPVDTILTNTWLDGVNGMWMRGLPYQALFGNAVSDAGDFDGDGIADMMVGSFQYDANGQWHAGEAFVVYGKNGGLPAYIAANDSYMGTATNATKLGGSHRAGEAGTSVSSAGDVNGDGLTDLLVGAPEANPGPERGWAGETYLVYGSTNTLPNQVVLTNTWLDGVNGMIFAGAVTNDKSGEAVSSAGDVNGDGLDDFLIGARYADPDGRDSAGEVYLVYGTTNLAANVTLTNSWFDGTNGVLFAGAEENNWAGQSVSDAGDVNGDGLDDFLIGATGYDTYGGTGTNAGATYLVYGTTNGLPGTVTLTNTWFDGVNGVMLLGNTTNDYSGVSVSAGDVNGDGLSDVLIGAGYADPDGLNGGGETYLIYGRCDLPAQITLNGNWLDGTNGIILAGREFQCFAGNAVSGGGDYNADGYDDMLIGAEQANPEGETYLVYGSPTPVVPAIGSWTGGYPVVISGKDMSNSDITNVTLCGLAANIISQSQNKVWVMAPTTTVSQVGDVVVQSVSYGTTIRSNGFTYVVPTLSMLGTNGAEIVSGDAVSLAKGSQFYAVKPSTPDYIYTFAITNSGNGLLAISGCTTNGANPDKFFVVDMPSRVDAGSVSNVEVGFYSTNVGSFAATVEFASDDPNTPFQLNLAGSCYAVSTNVGPYAGGNTITITNGYFGTITNILLGAPSVCSANLVAHGENWFTITLPPATTSGPVDFIVQTSTDGETLLRSAYTYNPAGILSTVSPSSGSWTGNYAVALSGTNLCNGNSSDITQVTLAGMTATVQNVYGSTQIVVTADASIYGYGTGDVVVVSTDYGTTTKSDAFEYLKESQSITFNSIANRTYGDASFDPGAEASSSLSVSYTSSDANVATVSVHNIYITGTGTCDIVASQAGNAFYYAAPAKTNTLTVAQKALTVSGVSASNKIYDASIAAQLSGGVLVGLVGVDEVSLGNVSTGTFAQATIGLNIEVTSYMTINGGDAGKYTLSQPSGITADITARELTVTGAVAQSKSYDWTTAATLSSTGTLVGVQGSDAITLGNNTTGIFASADVGAAIAVTSYMTISGVQTANYTLTQPTLSADITKASQSISFGSIGNQFWTNKVGLAATASSSGTVTFAVAPGCPAVITTPT
ncbi:MAG: choice-of-anchor D domain-containing protein, partial [Spartobacteria bacterium]|nr:choice-of-anchor D domain-containing protein [Spartobacteria bacterium]